MSKENKEWERLEQESSSAFLAFSCYRDMLKPRNLHGAEETYTVARGRHQKSIKSASGYFRKWAREYNWVERVQAYDDHLDSVKVEAIELNVKEEYTRMISEGQWIEETAIEELRKRDFSVLPIRELRLMLEHSIRLQMELHKASGLSFEVSNEDSIQRWLKATSPSEEDIKRIFEDER